MNPGNGDGPVRKVPPPPPPPRIIRNPQAPASNGNNSNAGPIPKPPSVNLSQSPRVARPPPPPLSTRKKPEPDSPFFSETDVDEMGAFFKKPLPQLPNSPPSAEVSAKRKDPPAPKQEDAPVGTGQIPASGEKGEKAEGQEPPQEEARFDSIHIDIDTEMKDAGAPLKTIFEGNLTSSPAAPFLEKFASLFSRLHPGCEGKMLRFSSDSVFLDSKKIGEVSLTSGVLHARIWLHELGYSLPMLPTSLISSIETEFRVFPGFVAKSLSSNSYISIAAEQTETRKGIRICFHKSMNSPPSSSAPVKFI